MKCSVIFLSLLAAYSLIAGNGGANREVSGKYQQLFNQNKQKSRLII